MNTGLQQNDANLLPNRDGGVGVSPDNKVRSLLSEIRTRILHGQSVADRRDKSYEAALARFLAITDRTDWQRQLSETVPYIDAIGNIASLRAVLFRLGFTTTVERFRAEKLRKEFLPCFLQTQTGDICLLERCTASGMLEVYNASEAETAKISPLDMDGILVFPEILTDGADETTTQPRSWSVKTVFAFEATLALLFVLSFATNFLSLAPPLFVMHVYDKAIGAGAIDSLWGLTIGIFFVLSADFGLRVIRGKIQSYFGARLDNQINEKAFRQLLFFPLAYTENAPLGSQLTRLSQMSSVREVFTGPLITALFDLPFVIIFVAAIAIIGGPLVWAPVSLIVGYFLLAVWAIPSTKILVKASGDKKAKLQNFIVEAISKQSEIYNLNAEEIWCEKHRISSAEFLTTNMRLRKLHNLAQTISQSFVTLAGVLTLAIGARMVIEGELSSGALIAVMALSWRILNPIRAIFLSTLTLGQSMQSIEQVDRLLKLPLERSPNSVPSVPRSFNEDIILDRISFRYPAQPEPALRSVSVRIKPGEVLAICGPSGAGKSTLLRMMMGLYQHQAGSISVGGVDLRQVDPGEWRRSLGVALERSDFFFGTIAQNIRLAHPAATDHEIEEILTCFKIDQFFGGALKHGFDTKISQNALTQWPEALKKRLLLARAFIALRPFYLLDNPADNLDEAGEAALLKTLEDRRRNSKIIMTTHRPSHMKIADKLLWLDQGRMRKLGKPEDVLPEYLATIGN
ncbi:MAG: ATP-binding cassette domain-containing protein [Marinicaulis sp.]|nr:ATP-binding cassette domain-containing protein [Marinicaulis sp.]